jgi:hypothetical protein
MKNAFRALLAGTIDYAGLFPPASLSLEQTVRNFLSYRTQPEAWMLGRLVCPAGRLSELASLVTGAIDDLHIAALVRGANSPEEFGDQLQSDLAAIGQLPDAICVDAAEFRVPVGFVVSVGRDSVVELLAMIDEALHEQRPKAIVYLELSDWAAETPVVEWQQVTKSFIESLAAYNRRNAEAKRPLGFKLRTGGVQAAAFPTSAQVAFAMIACRDAGLAWKATAGLHHPLRHFDAALRATMHGFLNVLAAAVLADACKLSLADVQSLLDEERAESFRFDDNEFRWHEWRATVDQITAARNRSLVSFGSCSFDEPRQDLQACGLL